MFYIHRFMYKKQSFLKYGSNYFAEFFFSPFFFLFMYPLQALSYCICVFGVLYTRVCIPDFVVIIIVVDSSRTKTNMILFFQEKRFIFLFIPNFRSFFLQIGANWAVFSSRGHFLWKVQMRANRTSWTWPEEHSMDWMIGYTRIQHT